jgi:hypothetical protein
MVVPGWGYSMTFGMVVSPGGINQVGFFNFSVEMVLHPSANGTVVRRTDLATDSPDTNVTYTLNAWLNESWVVLPFRGNSFKVLATTYNIEGNKLQFRVDANVSVHVTPIPKIPTIIIGNTTWSTIDGNSGELAAEGYNTVITIDTPDGELFVKFPAGSLYASTKVDWIELDQSLYQPPAGRQFSSIVIRLRFDGTSESQLKDVKTLIIRWGSTNTMVSGSRR